jgi:hypothetical protein
MVQAEAPRTNARPAAPRRGVRRLWVSCDESGIDGTNRYYGFGSLWMPDQRRGDFARLVADLRAHHGFKVEGEFKWTKVKRQKLDFYKAVVDSFFKESYLAFHCLVVRKGIVDREHFDGDMDLAMRVHLHMFLTNKVARCMKRNRAQDHKFKVWVDPLPSSYKKADEALLKIANYALVQSAGQAAIETVETKDSKQAPTIQLCDLLLGAVTDAWNQESTSEAKHELSRYIASHLGPTWTDLHAGTFAQERKFNIWYFQDPSEREVFAREVTLKYPLPDTIKGAI